MSQPADRRRDDSGAVTVEAALSLSALVVIVAFALAGVVAVMEQLRCTDSAREAARLIARGEPDLARLAVERIGPRGARLNVRTDHDKIEVEVLAEPLAGLLPGLRLSGEAFAVAEPGVIGVDGPP
jgi:starvation-inducible outer membrane lipoprotein